MYFAALASLLLASVAVSAEPQRRESHLNHAIDTVNLNNVRPSAELTYSLPAASTFTYTTGEALPAAPPMTMTAPIFLIVPQLTTPMAPAAAAEERRTAPRATMRQESPSSQTVRINVPVLPVAPAEESPATRSSEEESAEQPATESSMNMANTDALKEKPSESESELKQPSIQPSFTQRLTPRLTVQHPVSQDVQLAVDPVESPEHRTTSPAPLRRIMQQRRGSQPLQAIRPRLSINEPVSQDVSMSRPASSPAAMPAQPRMQTPMMQPVQQPTGQLIAPAFTFAIPVMQRVRTAHESQEHQASSPALGQMPQQAQAQMPMTAPLRQPLQVIAPRVGFTAPTTQRVHVGESEHSEHSPEAPLPSEMIPQQATRPEPSAEEAPKAEESRAGPSMQMPLQQPVTRQNPLPFSE